MLPLVTILKQIDDALNKRTNDGPSASYCFCKQLFALQIELARAVSDEGHRGPRPTLALLNAMIHRSCPQWPAHEQKMALTPAELADLKAWIREPSRPE